jgi:hypothetical protein
LHPNRGCLLHQIAWIFVPFALLTSRLCLYKNHRGWQKLKSEMWIACNKDLFLVWCWLWSGSLSLVYPFVFGDLLLGSVGVFSNTVLIVVKSNFNTARARGIQNWIKLIDDWIELNWTTEFKAYTPTDDWLIEPYHS